MVRGARRRSPLRSHLRLVDRWRGLCRAVLNGETKQMLPEVLQAYSVMDEGTKAGLRAAAECPAKATNCIEYAACSK